MPTINIPPRVRFALYLLGVLGQVGVQYAIDKTWFGDAELRMWSGVAAVLFAIAAMKVDRAEPESVTVAAPEGSDVTAHVVTPEE